MLDNLNNVIETQSLLLHHETLLFAASITSVVPLPGRDVPSSTSTPFNVIFVKCKADCKPFGGIICLHFSLHVFRVGLFILNVPA